MGFIEGSNESLKWGSPRWCEPEWKLGGNS
jgi:hypothetical protein